MSVLNLLKMALKKSYNLVTQSVQNLKNITITNAIPQMVLYDLQIYGTSNGVGDYNSTTEKYDIPVTLRGKNLLDYTVGSTSESNCKGYSYSNGICRATGIQGDASRGWGAGQVNFLFTKNPIPTQGKKIIISMYITRKSTYPITLSGNGERILWFANGTTWDGSIIEGRPYEYSDCPLNERTLIKWSYIPNYNLNQLNFRLAGAEFEFEFNTLQIEYGNKVTNFEHYATPQSVTMELDSPIMSGEYETLAENGKTLVTLPVTTNIIEVGTTETPAEITTIYYSS